MGFSSSQSPGMSPNIDSLGIRTTVCPRDLDCSCQSAKHGHAHLSHGPSPTLICIDECLDPDCHEVEQLKALQKSLDHFTDYDHYEKCCDGHHHVKHSHKDYYVTTNHVSCKTTNECGEDADECEEYAKKHQECYDEVDVCDEDCQMCEEECEEQGHEPEDCPHNHPTTRDNCIPNCELEVNPLPQLGPTDDFDIYAMTNVMQNAASCTNQCTLPMQPASEPILHPPAGMGFDSDMDHWQTFVQTHHCAPDPCIIGQPPQFQYPQHMEPSFGFTFGCDPSIPANQYHWQKQIPPCNVPSNSAVNSSDLSSTRSQHSSNSSRSKSLKTPQPEACVDSPMSSSDPPSRICQWIMPCGSKCGAAFARIEDLRKHIKNSHSTKGTVTCRWKACTASFATEAALTGHISKKHLNVSDEEGPWKCTVAGCTKSFMYKQVRDEHVASHSGGNRQHCPICHQYLNCEGSNFRRHMASHGPKNEHMKCRFESLGCKKRFPRLDNLRRHEACCKFGKRAAGVHHHHHRVHIGHDS